MQRLFWRFVTFADLNLCAVNVRQYLPKVARVDQRTADRAIAEMIGLGLRYAIRIPGRVSSPSYPKATPSGSFSLNHSSAASGVANTLR
jgi:triphosphoribosyl-dephospho-CoA synthetase